MAETCPECGNNAEDVGEQLHQAYQDGYQAGLKAQRRNNHDRGKRTAEARRCPTCRRSGALTNRRDGRGNRICRWAKSGRCGQTADQMPNEMKETRP